MMYSEFIEGTGCKDNAHNYKVLCDLEVMYMNSNLSKADIYEYGKKLVDNSKTPEQLKLESEIKAEIKGLREDIEYSRKQIECCTTIMMNMCKNEGDKAMAKHEQSMIKYYKDKIKRMRSQIVSLKWVLE